MEWMSSKRRRLNKSFGSLIGLSNNDIYEEARDGGAGTSSASTSAATCPTTYQTWLSCNSTFRHDGDDDDGDDEGQVGCNQNGATDKACDGDDSDDGALLRSQIFSLQDQLSDVKRRLGPAAEQCAAEASGCSSSEFIEARRACNPLSEQLGELHDFINRSAIKLANIDAILDFCLTSIPNNMNNKNNDNNRQHEDHRESGSKTAGTNGEKQECFRFADLCGAPGGFSEYLMKRCTSSMTDSRRTPTIHCCCRGYGMSLTGRNKNGKGAKWRLSKRLSYVENGTHVRYRLFFGSDGTGDIFRWENVEGFKRMILKENNQSRVHLVLADGGFDAQRDAENQEELTQKLVVCEVSAALELLCSGGTFVLKMFGFQTTIIRTMIQDLSTKFDSIMALKPISSRPASAERYVVFSSFKGNLSSDWCGRSWQKQILATHGGSDSGSKSVVAKGLSQYLDEFDRDLLSLNLKACSSILSFLEERKCTCNASQEQLPEPTVSVVDVVAYKQAWRLAGTPTSMQ